MIAWESTKNQGYIEEEHFFSQGTQSLRYSIATVTNQISFLI